MADVPDLDTPAPWTHQASRSYPCSPSGSSTTSSSSPSDSSIDAPSSKSSVSSASTDLPSLAYADTQYYYIPHARRHVDSVSSHEVAILSNYKIYSQPRSQSQPRVPLPSELRQHPRRTQRLKSSGSNDEITTSQYPRPPPSLVRQSARKENFVDSLVGELIYRQP